MAQAPESKITTHFQVRRDSLPLHCPRLTDSKWDAHPRVFLKIGKRGESKCPYCGAEYQIID